MLDFHTGFFIECLYSFVILVGCTLAVFDKQKIGGIIADLIVIF